MKINLINHMNIFHMKISQITVIHSDIHMNSASKFIIRKHAVCGTEGIYAATCDTQESLMN